MISNSKIKILFIHHGIGIGGAAISLLNLIKQLDKSKFECKVAFMVDGDITSYFKRENIKTEIIGCKTKHFAHHEKGKIQIRYFLSYISIFLNWQKVKNKIAPHYLSQNQNYDIVHLNSDVLSSWAVAAKKSGFKVVCHNRDPVAKGIFGLRRKILQSLLSNSVDKIISISKDNKRRMGLLDMTDVVYNFITLPKSYRKTMSSNDLRKVIHLGGTSKVKGVFTVVNCLHYLNDNIMILFAGNMGKLDDPITLMDKFKNFIKLTLYRSIYLPLLKMKESRNAQILGLLKEPLPFINNSDILITAFKIEHFSRPAVEAFAYGKPVIGSDVEGMDEIIDHKVNGLLVEKNNPKALAEAINYLCQHPKKAQAMGQKGRAKAEQVFSPEINTKKIEAIYQMLISN